MISSFHVTIFTSKESMDESDYTVIHDELNYPFDHS